MKVGQTKFDGINLTHQVRYVRGVSKKFNQETMFGPTEVSTLLDMLKVRYIEQTAKANVAGLNMEDATQRKKEVIDWLARSQVVTTKLGKWACLYGSSNDEEGHHGLYTLIENNVVVDMASLQWEVLDTAKAPKDMKRILNHYKHAMLCNKIVARAVVTGKLRGKDVPGELVVVETTDGKRFIALNWFLKGWSKSSKALADGKAKTHPDALKYIGAPLYSETTRFYVTWFTEMGVCKGISDVDARLRSIPIAELGGEEVPIWFVSYGAKKRVLYKNHFFMGVLGYCHKEKVMTDIQSLANFEGDRFIRGRAEDLAMEIAASLTDVERLKAVLLRTCLSLDLNKRDEDIWTLIQLLKADINPLMIPGGLGKIVSHLMNALWDAERGRMDVSPVALRVAFDTDRTIWDDFGLPSMKGIIPKGVAVCMDIPESFYKGEEFLDTATHRQPVGHSLEHARVRMWNVRLVLANLLAIENPTDEDLYKIRSLQTFMSYIGKYIVFFGRGCEAHLLKMNGADLDDHGMLYFDPQIVATFYALNYPVTGKLEDLSEEAAAGAATKFASRVAAQLQKKVFGGYCFKDFIEGARKSLAWSMKIGQIVNLIMLDTLLSGRHKQHMLRWLKARIANPQEGDNVELYKRAYRWLKARKDYILRHQASNLEALIDFTQQAKDLGQQGVLDAMIKEMSKLICEKDDKGNLSIHTIVFPEIWMTEERNRIPKALKEGRDFILAPSELCSALADIKVTRKVFQEQCGLLEFQLRQPLPLVLENKYLDTLGAQADAEEMRDMFNVRISELMNAKLDRESFRKEYKALLAWWEKELSKYCEHTQESIIMGIWRIVIDPRREAKGSGLPASALMNNVSMAIFVRACRKVGIAGECYSVEFGPYCEYLQGKDHKVEVTSSNVWIPAARKHDRYWIGTTSSQCPDGEYTLTSWGYIRVKEADASLQFQDMQALMADSRDIMEMTGATQLRQDVIQCLNAEYRAAHQPAEVPSGASAPAEVAGTPVSEDNMMSDEQWAAMEAEGVL